MLSGLPPAKTLRRVTGYVAEMLCRTAATSHCSPDSDCQALGAQLAAHLKVDVSHVIVSNGSNALIELVARVGLSGGGDVLMVDPCFQAYAMAAAGPVRRLEQSW